MRSTRGVTRPRSSPRTDRKISSSALVSASRCERLSLTSSMFRGLRSASARVSPGEPAKEWIRV